MGESQPEFSVDVYAARVIRSTLRDSRRVIDEAVIAGGERRDGAGITLLDAWMRAHVHADFIFGGLWDQNLETAERLLTLCGELAESIAILFESPSRLAAAPFVLERALGEAIMRIAHIFDPNVLPARTVARMAAYQLETIEGNLHAALAFGENGVEEVDDARAQIAEMHGFLERAGFTRLPARREPFTASVEIGGERENLKFNATEAFKRYLPSSPWMWELGSGVTHGRGWMLGSLIATTQTEAVSTDVDVALSVGGAVVELADALARTAAGHSGVDVDWFLKKNHLRRRGLSSWSGRGARLSVDHKEYASRPANFRARQVPDESSFYRPRKG